jgi:hypothetical protein
MTTSSSSSRNVRVLPSGSRSGCVPLCVSSSSEPYESCVAPLMVPEPIRSPTRVLHPDAVWCASCCAMLQYIVRKFVRQIVVGALPAGASAASRRMS